MEGILFEFEIQYPEELHELHNNLTFSTEEMKIEKLEKIS